MELAIILIGLSIPLTLFCNWQSTLKRSALRITREVELLGGEVSSTHSRENVVLKAKFLSNDLPYFAELLGEVAAHTKYSGTSGNGTCKAYIRQQSDTQSDTDVWCLFFADHELHELVLNLVKYRQQALLHNAERLADNAAHGVAFHRGLGETITPIDGVFEKYISTDALASFAKEAYAKSNVAVVASGATSSELSKWVGEFFRDLPTGSVKQGPASKYYGGEQRIASKTGNAMVIAFPGSSMFGAAGYKPEAAVLAALLGGESSIKWTPGFSLLSQAAQGFSQLRVTTKNLNYSDAGLFSVSLSGAPDQIAAAGKQVVEILKKTAAGDVNGEQIKKAIALAKFRALESVQTLETGVESTGAALINGSKPYNIEQYAQSIDKVSAQQVKDVRYVITPSFRQSSSAFWLLTPLCPLLARQIIHLRQSLRRNRR